jgi:hypothetical protein
MDGSLWHAAADPRMTAGAGPRPGEIVYKIDLLHDLRWGAPLAIPAQGLENSTYYVISL